MKCTRPLLTMTVLLLSVGIAACGRNPDPAPPAPIEAQEAPAETFEAFGNYVVHFNAQLTTRLTPEIARGLEIQRSDDRAMLNISVIDRTVEGAPAPVAAEVRVTATNLAGQIKELRFRELREGDAIYYLGEFPVADEEIVNFEISVRPEDMDAPHQFSFQQQFYTN
jgi:hypothetical protein